MIEFDSSTCIGVEDELKGWLQEARENVKQKVVGYMKNKPEQPKIDITSIEEVDIMEELLEQHLQDKYNDDLEDLCTSDAVTIACEDFPELIQQILQATSLDASMDIVEALRESVYGKFKEMHKDEVEQGLYDNLRGYNQ